MRLPLIKHIVDFVGTHDEDWVAETIELLENIAEAPGMKEEEMEHEWKRKWKLKWKDES